MKFLQTSVITACLVIMATISFSVTGLNTLSAQATESATQEEKKTDWAPFNGIWKPASGKFAGQDMAEASLGAMTLTMKDGEFEVVAPGMTDKGKLTLGEASEEDGPKTMDIKGEAGPNAGQTIPAIYKFNEGNLIICYGISGTRPTDFVSDQDNPNLLLEYKKEETEGDK